MRRFLRSWICVGACGVMLGVGGAESWRHFQPEAPSLVASPAPSPSPELASPPAEVTVHFAPRGNITDAIVTALDSAENDVCVQAYGFTSAPIVEALLRAHHRGVRVTVLLDKSNEQTRYPAARQLEAAGVTVRIDHKPAIAHNKIILIDVATVITGSFNFTTSAEKRNAENCLFITGDAALFRQYRDYFAARWSEGRELKR